MQVVHLAAQGNLRKASERLLDRFPQQILLGGLVLNALESMWYLHVVKIRIQENIWIKT